jgi:SAM-dependent methyltransferase
MSATADWFDGFFEREWLDYLALDRKSTDDEVAFLIDKLELTKGTRVLDLACGRGRVSIPLARNGCRVTGVDLSPKSLELARRDAAAGGVMLELIESDMRKIDFDPEFDVVINLFTSFGYFQDHSDNERVVHAVARSLKRGGRFLIDTINPITIAAGWRERDWQQFDDGTVMIEHRRHDQLQGRHETTWTFVRGDGARTEQKFSLRAYTAAELREMLEAAGLHVDGAWGSWEGTELGDGYRTILRAHRG